MFGDTLQTQATHWHSHTHAVHPSTYRAAADSGLSQRHAGEGGGRCRLGDPPAGGGRRGEAQIHLHGVRARTQNAPLRRWRKDSLTAAAAAAAPPLDATPSGECHWQF